MSIELVTGLETVNESSGLLVSWALAIVGASIATIVGTSYLRPRNKSIRFIYLLFVPGWVFLGLSMYYGQQISRRYMAALFVSEGKLREISKAINEDFGQQLLALQVGLIFFALWLFLFLLWWIFGDWSVSDERN